MAVTQAVVLIDHHSAQIQRLADSGSERVKEHASHTRQHGSNVRSEHDFFSDVCDALASIGETLVVGWCEGNFQGCRFQCRVVLLR